MYTRKYFWNIFSCAGWPYSIVQRLCPLGWKGSHFSPQKKKKKLKRSPIETNLSCDLHVDVRKHKNQWQPSKEGKTKIEDQAWRKHNYTMALALSEVIFETNHNQGVVNKIKYNTCFARFIVVQLKSLILFLSLLVEK